MFIAAKPCSFAGQSFLIGEVVPAEIVDVNAIARLKRMRVLTEVDDVQKETVEIPAEKPLFSVPILTDNGNLSVELTAEDLEKLFMVLQNNVTKAGELIATIDNKDLLLCVHAVDSRKTIQAAAKERAAALTE